VIGAAHLNWANFPGSAGNPRNARKYMNIPENMEKTLQNTRTL